MSIASFIRRLLLAAEEAVNASVDRALGEEVPLDVLLTEDDAEEEHAWGAGIECPGCAAADARNEQVGDDTLAMLADSQAAASVYLTPEQYADRDTVSAWASRLVAEQETAELEDLLKLPAFERGQA